MNKDVNKLRREYPNLYFGDELYQGPSNVIKFPKYKIKRTKYLGISKVLKWRQ